MKDTVVCSSGERYVSVILSWCYDAYKELLLLIVIYLAPMPLLTLIVPLYLIVSSKMQLLLQTRRGFVEAVPSLRRVAR